MADGANPKSVCGPISNPICCLRTVALWYGGTASPASEPVVRTDKENTMGLIDEFPTLLLLLRSLSHFKTHPLLVLFPPPPYRPRRAARSRRSRRSRRSPPSRRHRPLRPRPSVPVASPAAAAPADDPRPTRAPRSFGKTNNNNNEAKKEKKQIAIVVVDATPKLWRLPTTTTAPLQTTSVSSSTRSTSRLNTSCPRQHSPRPVQRLGDSTSSTCSPSPSQRIQTTSPSRQR
jgi:hypothetical protein